MRLVASRSHRLDKLKAVESNNKALKKSATQLRKEVTIALKEKVHIEQELSQKVCAPFSLLIC